MSIDFGGASQVFGWSASKLRPWAPIPIRLIVGYGFMACGFAKLMRGPEHFADILHALSVPMPHLMAWLTIMVELVGGLAVFTGAFVPLASVPLAAILCFSVYRATAQRFSLYEAAGRHVHGGSIGEARI